MQNKGGVEEKGLESKAGFWPTELGVSSFQVGLWESVQVRAVSRSLPVKVQTMSQNSSGRSH